MSDFSVPSSLVIHTDGACSGNPGPGGWGAFWADASGTVELMGGMPQTTNNQMEVLAVLQTLRTLRLSHSAATLKIRSDSQYVVKGITQWRKGWEQRNWRTVAGAPVKNAEMWREMVDLVDAWGPSLSFEWVRGHNGDAGNEHADALAQEGLRRARAKRGPGTWSRRNGVLVKIS